MGSITEYGELRLESRGTGHSGIEKQESELSGNGKSESA
jgi:hypothetical protein